VLDSEKLSILSRGGAEEGEEEAAAVKIAKEVPFRCIKRVCLAQEQSLLEGKTKGEKSVWISTGTTQAVASGLWLVFDCNTKAQLWCLVLLLLSDLKKHKEKACGTLKSELSALERG
jgi:hypothetical protein